jgi:hypothetical protein
MMNGIKHWAVVAAFFVGAPACMDPPEEDSVAGQELDKAEAVPVEEGQDGQPALSDAIATLAASSSSIAFTDGTRAAEAFFNRGAPAFIDLFDAKCDAHSVYVLYRINN